MVKTFIWFSHSVQFGLGAKVYEREGEVIPIWIIWNYRQKPIHNCEPVMILGLTIANGMTAQTQNQIIILPWAYIWKLTYCGSKIG